MASKDDLVFPYDAELAKAEANPDCDVIVDAPYDGAPLVIAFGFADWRAPPRFDFARRLRKLQAADDRPLNLILVRDTANLWYQHGVLDLGQDVHGTTNALLRMAVALDPPALGTIGQSMGGYAAILFGTLLNASRVLAFGPLSYLRSDWARRDDDLRWLGVMEMLDRYPPAYRYDDLPTMLARRGSSPPIHAVYGTAPAPPGEPANCDLLHASRYAALRDVEVETIAEADHAVVAWLIAQRRIDDVVRRSLLDRLFDSAALWSAPAQPPAHDRVRGTAWNDGWRTWIAENLALGAAEDALLGTLVTEGFHPGKARREVYKAARSPYLVPLARLLERRGPGGVG